MAPARKARSPVGAVAPIVTIVIVALAALALAELFGLMRLTGSVMKQMPDFLALGSVASGTVPAASSSNEQGAFEGGAYVATPERVWQSTGLASGHARRAIMYLVTNSTGKLERKRDRNDFPPGFGGIDGPDGYYVQHLLSGVRHLEDTMLSKTLHPDVLIVHSADVDGPRLAREVAKHTRSAVVSAPVDFTRTAPGYENATTAFTTCWVGNDWGINYLNMNYFFIHTMWSLPVFQRYDLVMRIDTDLWLNSTIPCDPFTTVEKRDLAFMFYAGGNDGEACTRGQKTLALNWAKQKGVDTKALDNMGGGEGREWSPVYHGAIHLYNLTFWKRPDVQELLRIYADNGGIYRHRWSDQSTFPFVLGTFSAKHAMMGGFRVYHVSGPIFRERWGDDGYCKS